MKHESSTAKLLKLAEIPAENYADPVSRKELRNAVQQALFEISTGLQGTALNAYHQCCSIEGGDVGWQEAGTLQEMQTVCLLADLLGFVANAADAVNGDITY